MRNKLQWCALMWMFGLLNLSAATGSDLESAEGFRILGKIKHAFEVELYLKTGAAYISETAYAVAAQIDGHPECRVVSDSIEDDFGSFSIDGTNCPIKLNQEKYSGSHNEFRSYFLLKDPKLTEALGLSELTTRTRFKTDSMNLSQGFSTQFTIVESDGNKIDGFNYFEQTKNEQVMMGERALKRNREITKIILGTLNQIAFVFSSERQIHNDMNGEIVSDSETCALNGFEFPCEQIQKQTNSETASPTTIRELVKQLSSPIQDVNEYE